MTSDNAPSSFAAVHAAVLSDEYTGKTVEDVTRRALIAGNLTRDEAVVRVLSEGSPGLFGLMGAKPARVIIAPKPERPDACVKYFLSKVFALLGLGRTTVNVHLSPSTFDVSVLFTEPSYTDLFARNNGEAYNALYVVLEAFVRRIDRNLNVSLDVNGLRRHLRERARSAIASLKNRDEVILHRVSDVYLAVLRDELARHPGIELRTIRADRGVRYRLRRLHPASSAPAPSPADGAGR